jgi:hypothetical protein
MDELHGILTTYEMRTEQEKPSRKEATLKVSKKIKKNNQKSKSCSSCSEDSNDEEEANFVRKLKQGTGKFKGKLPFKCFNCGKIGHFASKYPYAKGSKIDEEEETPKNEKKHQKIHKGKLLKKKNLYSKEVSSSSDEDDSDNESRKVIFMEFEENIENNEDNCEEEREVNLEGELISALCDLKKERKKNKKLKEELSEMKESIQDSINPKELSQIEKNETWELVPRPKDINVIGTKWVFINKFNEDE